jgi:hypothetical protein
MVTGLLTTVGNDKRPVTARRVRSLHNGDFMIKTPSQTRFDVWSWLYGKPVLV